MCISMAVIVYDMCTVSCVRVLARITYHDTLRPGKYTTGKVYIIVLFIARKATILRLTALHVYAYVRYIPGLN